MKIAILDVRQGSGRVAAKSYTVAYRNLCVLRDHFNADLFVNASEIKQDSDYDIIICGFGSTSCERERSTDFLMRNKSARLFWLVGEYEQSTFDPLFYSRREFEVIKNFEHSIRNKRCSKQHFVNINTLLARPQNKPVQKKYGCVYYGRWRPDRLPYFERYLHDPLYLSTGSKNIKEYFHRGCSPRIIAPLSWSASRETLNLFAASLYIEDVYTHTHYNCLANRYYEALFCGAVPLFDASCANTLRRSGIQDYDWHVVECLSDVTNKVESIGECQINRVSRWAEEAVVERKKSLEQISAIFASG